MAAYTCSATAAAAVRLAAQVPQRQSTAAATAAPPRLVVAVRPGIRHLAPFRTHRAGSNLQQWQQRQRGAFCGRCQAGGVDGGEVPQPLALFCSSDDEPVPVPSTGSSTSSMDSSSTGAPPAAAAGGQQAAGAAGSGNSSSSGGGSEGGESDGGVKIDLQLPRRSLLVQFTCNLCGGRSERLVNPVAWERGMVIAKCQHCDAWHKLADAANLVEEIRYADLEDE